MRIDEQWLGDILSAADEIADFLSEVDLSDFLNDRMLQRAVLYDLIIGEAANRVSDDMKSRYPEINWRGAISMRNFAAHEYFAVTLERIWATATDVLPLFREQMLQILEDERLSQDTDTS